MPNDLSTKIAQYVVTLKTANVAALDVTTLVQNNLATVIAAKPAEVDDRNTLYFTYITG